LDSRTLVTVMALILFGLAYARLVRGLRMRYPDHGQTPWLVAMGVAVVLVAYGIVAGVEQALLVALLFGAAGVPMVFEYVDAYSSQLSRQKQAKNMSDLTERK